MKEGHDISVSAIFKVGYFLPLAIFGLMHLFFPSYFGHLVPTFVPGGMFWVYFSGVALTLSGACIILGLIPKITAFCLILFVLTFILAVDLPGIIFEVDRFRFLISLLKDISLLTGTGLFLRLM